MGTVDDTDEVPDASRITPPRIDEMHPDAAYLRLEGTLNLGELDGELESPNHAIFVQEKDGVLQLRPKDPREFPNRDFVLRWQLAKPDQPALRGWRSGGYALIELTAPESVPGAEEFEQDVYFLLDRSGSMMGEKWVKAATALIEFLKVLGPNDRGFATIFESEFKDVTEKPKLASDLLADRRLTDLPRKPVRGGTELLPAFQHILKKIDEHSLRAERHATVVLITDGQVGNESRILKLSAERPQLRVHTFGIDNAVNDGFLKTLARQQRGTSLLQSPNDDITGGVVALGRNMRAPVLLDVQVSDGWELTGGSIADLFGGQVLTVPMFGKVESLEITANLPKGETWSVEASLTDVSTDAIRLMWSRARIQQLQADGQHDEAIGVATVNNLLCDGVSFVAVDESEQVDVAEEGVYQPSMSPPSPAAAGIAKRRRGVTLDPNSYSLYEGGGGNLDCLVGWEDVRTEDVRTEDCEENSELKKLLNMGVSEVEFSIDVQNLLDDREVSSIGALSQLGEDELSPHCSAETIDEIKEKLSDLGLALGMRFDPALLESPFIEPLLSDKPRSAELVELIDRHLPELEEEEEDHEVAYTDDDIVALKWHEHIRLRPGMYIGSVDEKGVTELIAILVDECIEQGGSTISIDLSKELEIAVERDGPLLSDLSQGLPTENKAGGKYEHHLGNQRRSARTNIGVKVAVCLSSKILLRSRGPNEIRELQVIGVEPGEITSQSTDDGLEPVTRYECQLDREIFEAKNADVDYLVGLLRASALEHPGMIFQLRTDTLTETLIEYPDGVADRLAFLYLEGEVLAIEDSCDFEKNTSVKVSLAIQQLPNDAQDHDIEAYVNGRATSAGIHMDALRDALGDEAKYAAVVYLVCNHAQFESQSRSKLTGPNEIGGFVGELAQKLLSSQ
ncbi:MAG: VWA domain-containing protein [Verrucomicrobiota bacterium]